MSTHLNDVTIRLTRSGDVMSLRSRAALALVASRWLAAGACDVIPVPNANAKRAPFGAESALFRPETGADWPAPSKPEPCTLRAWF